MPVDLSKSVSNPYANQHYRESPWQSFLSNLGFRTQADAWRENMAVQAAEFDSALQQKAADMEYNDPIHQLERMRAAGLNPDIDGGSSISPGEATSLPQDPSTPMQSTGWDGTIQTLGTSILGAFSTALGIVNSIQGVAARSIQNGKSVVDFAREQFPNLIPSVPPQPEGEDSPEFTLGDVRQQGIEMARIFSNENVPKRFRKKFMNAIDSFWSSAPGTREAFDEWSKMHSSQRNYAVNSRTLWDQFNGILWPIAKEISDMNTDIFKQNQKTELAEGEASEAGAQTEKAYQNELDGQLMGASQNAQNQSSLNSSSSLSIVSGHIKNIMDFLEEGSKKGGLEGALSSIALTIISGLYLYVQSGIHPSISRSEGSGSFSGLKGSGSSSKSSYSIGF